LLYGCVTVTVIVDVTPQVKAVFGTGKKRVAGCEVTTGKLSKGAMIEVVRGSGKEKTVVFTGKLASLRRIKDTVNEVSSGHLSCCSGHLSCCHTLHQWSSLTLDMGSVMCLLASMCAMF
jgi:translation initiation factor IF-2